MVAYVRSDNAGGPSATLARLGRDFDLLHSLAAAQVFSHMALSMHSVDLSFSQINALFRLYGHGPQRIADLAAGAHVSQCAASRLVERLVAEGLVEKQTNLENRREKLVRLSAAGLAYLQDLQQKTAAAYESILQALPPPLAQRLLDVLEEIIPHLPPAQLVS
ncbi:MarR family winged helix-turn-helix transcriptional regulator [Solidesulfovibrio sp. C21]|uniref:MarR family winged helix-turn-helix transcriptional regulator n=1 Tax=Solidesulfovibrio sp. C21 TaxID=3398613 RepID=UPI0039FC661E